MMQQLQVGNRFHSLAPDDPDNTDSDRPTTEQPPGDASSTGSGTEYFDVQEDAFYFQAKADQPPREPWDVAHPIDFNQPRPNLLPHSSDRRGVSSHERHIKSFGYG